MSTTVAIHAIHTAVKGRARYRVHGLYRSPSLQRHLEVRLAEEAGIRAVSASTLTGNILLLFHPDVCLATITALLTTIVAEYVPQSTDTSHSVARRPPATVNGAHVSSSASAAWMLRRRVQTAPQAAVQVKPQESASWHCLTTDTVIASLRTAPDAGLSRTAVQHHLRMYGPNRPPEVAPRSGLSIFLRQFASLPVALLGVAGGVSVATGGLADAFVIAGVMVINAVIGYVTESQSERTIHSLRRAVKPAALVRRDGDVCTVQAEEIVPGDVLVLRPGSYVAADARLIETQRLSVNESVLTGESLPVRKLTAALQRADVPLGDRSNMVYTGTYVVGGQGLAVVVATGRHTEMAQIQTLVETAQSPKTPLQRQLHHLGRQLVLLSSAVCALVFGIGLLRGYGGAQMLKTSIALAVAAVPEGLPTVATMVLAIGIRTLRRHRVFIRHLGAVETLGAIQVICLDKTGTLTYNKMSVVAIHTGGQSIHVANSTFHTAEERLDPLDCEELLRIMHVSALCSETEVVRRNGTFVLHGSSTENALLQMAITAGIDIAQIRQRHPLLRIRHRAENHNSMRTLHATPDDRRLIAVKGSPQEVLAMCAWQLHEGQLKPLDTAARTAIESENERMASAALRVLGLAYNVYDDGDPASPQKDLIWLGLVGMMDPIRDGVQDAIEQFHQAGIDTVMLTGDQSTTAHAISKALRLSRDEQIEHLDATQLTHLDPEVLTALASRVRVFARVSPSHKLEIVQALQRVGKVVAMTGDGLNDGPALKAADIGIAMGHSGTDMAREVADVVLEDDNLETMIIAVSQGRTIYTNIRKSVHFLLATNLSEMVLMLTAMSLGMGQPLNAMQLLWINLLTDIAPGLALAVEPPEPDVLCQPPRNPCEPIVQAADLKRIAFESAVLSTGALGAYGYGLARYGMGAQANTLAFTSLTAGQLLHALSCRSQSRGLFDTPALPKNSWLTMALGGSFALQLLAMLVPGLRRLLGLTPLMWRDGIVVGLGAVMPLIVNEGTKRSTRASW